jgi:integrase
MSTKSDVATELGLRSTVRRMQADGITGDVSLGDGLQVRVGTAKVTFSLKFVDRRSGRQDRVKLGHYPALGLGEARRRAKEHQARIADPQLMANPARDRREREAMPTFRELAARRLEDERLASRTREYYAWCLETHAHARIGDFPAGDVRAEDVVAIVDAVARDHPTSADRVQTAIASVFTWAVRERIVSSNPARGIGRRAADVPRDRVPDDADLRLVIRGIDSAWAPTASPSLGRILHLLLLTGARSSEVRESERGDLRWDGHGSYRGPVWVVPGDRLRRGRRVRGRTKSGREKVLPLSRQAAALFREALGACGERDRLFDVAEKRAVSYAMQRACARAGLSGDRAVTPHDFRRAVSTWLADRGERPDVIETILGHSAKGVTRLHYNHSLLLPLVADALQRWADHLDTLRTGTAGDPAGSAR